MTQSRKQKRNQNVPQTSQKQRKHKTQTIRQTGNIKTFTGRLIHPPPRGGVSRPRVSVSAVPLEFWASIDPVKETPEETPTERDPKEIR